MARVEQAEGAARVADVGDAEEPVGRPRMSPGERLDDNGLGDLVEGEQRDSGERDRAVTLQERDHRPISLPARAQPWTHSPAQTAACRDRWMGAGRAAMNDSHAPQ